MFKMLRKVLSPNTTREYNRKSVHFIPYENNYYSNETINYNKAQKLYTNNVIVNRCVNLIAQSLSHVPWILNLKTSQSFERIYEHPLLDLLHKPNNLTAGAEFFEYLIIHKLIYGNAYILAEKDKEGFPEKLKLLDPQTVSIITNKNNEIVGYKYSKKEDIYKINPIDFTADILHLKNYNPNNSFYGLSSLSSSSLSIEQHNLALAWNNSLLKNGARPSGAIIVGTNHGNNGYLTEEQFNRIKEEFEERYTGSANSGKPLLLEGGLEWKDMSISPKDMDFIEAKNASAREIALSLGVPPQLLGIAGDNTYSNMQEARLALWEETIIPILDNLCDALTNWLTPKYNQELRLSFDRDEISALSSKRENMWLKLKDIDFMTINEKRAKFGLKAIEEGDKLQ